MGLAIGTGSLWKPAWLLRRGTDLPCPARHRCLLRQGLLERGRSGPVPLTDCCRGSVLQPGTLGTVLSAWAVWKTCFFPALALDLEVLFSCANVLSCEADVPFAVSSTEAQCA